VQGVVEQDGVDEAGKQDKHSPRMEGKPGLEAAFCRNHSLSRLLKELMLPDSREQTV